MTTRVIEVNDAGLIVSGADGMLLDSPGYAVLDGQELFLGAEAYARARLRPRWTNNRFWSQLNLEALSNATGRIRSHADLAYAHLAHVWEQAGSDTDEVLLAVPGTIDKQQLGLLLGIARECAIPVSGMVDSAVAASSEAAPSQRLMHLDIQLHRIVLTLLEQNASLTRGKILTVAESGLVTLRDAWVNVIEDAFVRNTRFDPMHQAETEQQLYQQLPGWLTSLQDIDTTTIEMQAGGQTHSVTLTRDQLLAATAEVYPHIVQQVRAHAPAAGPFTLQVSHRFEGFPGLADTLALLSDCDTVALTADAAARGALKYREHIRSEGESLSYVTSIPWHGGRAAGGETAARMRPTHILYQARAYRINERPHVLGAEVSHGAPAIPLSGPLKGVSRRHCSIYLRDGDVRVEDHSTYGTFVNNKKIEGSAVLKVGDIVRLGGPGQEVQLISMVD